MKYFDPITVLKLDNFDPEHIRKTKKRRLSDIQLSDDEELEYAGGNLTRSEVLGLFSQLESDETREHYSVLTDRRELSAYLQKGDLTFFESGDVDDFESESFTRFLADFFPERYSNDFLKAYQSGDVFALKVLGQRQVFLSYFSADNLYGTTLVQLRDIPETLKQIQYKIDQEDDGAAQIPKMEALIGGINISMINSLPDYFSGVRTNIAQGMRNLSVSVFNELDEIDLALSTIKKATTFKLNEDKKDGFANDFEKLANIKRERGEEELYGVQFKHYSDKMVFIMEVLEGLKNESLTEKALEQSIDKLGDLGDLNEFPSVFDSIRDQLAIGLRALSVNIYNTFSRVDLATHTLNIAGSIKASASIRKDINEASRQLAEAGQQRADNIAENTELMAQAVRNVPFGSSVDVGALETMIYKTLSEGDLRFIAGAGGRQLRTTFENLKFLTGKISIPEARKIMKTLADSVSRADHSYQEIKDYSEKLNSSSVFGRKVEHQVKRSAAQGAANATGLAIGLFYRVVGIAIFIGVLALLGTIADSCN
jgi:hypothetical protein